MWWVTPHVPWRVSGMRGSHGLAVVLERLHAELAHLAPMLLPPEARAITMEAIETQVTARVYLHGPGSLARWADLDARLAPLIERRLPSEDDWNVIVQAIRQDRPVALEVFGTVVWVEEGTQIRSRDGRDAGR